MRGDSKETWPKRQIIITGVVLVSLKSNEILKLTDYFFMSFLIKCHSEVKKTACTFIIKKPSLLENFDRPDRRTDQIVEKLPVHFISFYFGHNTQIKNSFRFFLDKDLLTIHVKNVKILKVLKIVGTLSAPLETC